MSLNFNQHITLLDQNSQATRQLIDFISIFPYSFKIQTVCEDFFNCELDPFQLVIGNHMLDDLLISFYCRKTNQDFQKAIESEPNYLQTTNEIVGLGSNFIDDFVSAYVRRLTQLTQSNGTLILTHYPGIIDTALNQKQWQKLLIDTQNIVVARLLEMHFNKTTRALGLKTDHYFQSQHLDILTRT